MFCPGLVRKKPAKPVLEPAKRRTPTQARSLRRYEAIVVAAAEAFTDHGFDATTMEGIAARAGTSIGSLYQFFPNKLALFRELASRCMALSRAKFAELLGPNPGDRPWRELVDVVADGYRELQQDPVMAAVLGNIQLYGEYAAQDAALLREMTLTVAGLMAVWAPRLPARQREVCGTLVVHSMAAAMFVIRRQDAMADELLAETKRLVTCYLESYIDA